MTQHCVLNLWYVINYYNINKGLQYASSSICDYSLRNIGVPKTDVCMSNSKLSWMIHCMLCPTT